MNATDIYALNDLLIASLLSLKELFTSQAGIYLLFLTAGTIFLMGILGRIWNMIFRL